MKFSLAIAALVSAASAVPVRIVPTEQGAIYLGVPLPLVRDETLPAAPLSLAVGNDVPTAFDWRNSSLPQCVGAVRNQGKCGSCWAEGCATSLSDRFCIASGGAQQVELATAELVACDNNDGGCQGGELGTAWEFAQNTGLVDTTCYPYPIPGDCSPQPCMPNTFVPTPSCPSSCPGTGDWNKRYYAKSAYNVGGDFDSIAAEIYANGPVELAFEVYENFLTFNFANGAVYRQTGGQLLGGHAVSAVGFGQTSDGVNFFTIRNSWTTSWGDNGYFNIAADTAGIMSNPVAGMPKLN